MYKELDIQINVNTSSNDIQLNMDNLSKDIQISLDKSIPKDIQIELDETRSVISERDYEKLKNQPQINSVQLIGNKTSNELGLQDELPIITRAEIRNIINNL